MRRSWLHEELREDFSQGERRGQALRWREPCPARKVTGVLEQMSKEQGLKGRKEADNHAGPCKAFITNMMDIDTNRNHVKTQG